MNLFTTIEIYAGGPGSGCNPAKGKCGRPTTTGAIRPALKKVVNKVSALYPSSVTDGLNVKMTSQASEHGGAYTIPYSKRVFVDPKTFSEDIWYDSANNGTVKKGYEKNYPDAKRIVPDVGAYNFHRTMSHELGHVMYDRLPDDLKRQAAKLFGKKWLIDNSTTAAYANYISERALDADVPFVVRNKQVTEQVAEAFRMKASDPKEFRQLPLKVKDWVNKAWEAA